MYNAAANECVSENHHKILQQQIIRETRSCVIKVIQLAIYCYKKFIEKLESYWLHPVCFYFFCVAHIITL